MAIRTLELPPKEITRLVRFLLAGALGTVIDFGLLTALKTIGAPTLLANSISFSAGPLNNYTWNSRWTFEDRVATHRRAQFLQFLSVSLVGLAINNAILLLLEAPLGTWIGDADWGYAPAKIVATGVAMFWNYFANRNWTFKETR